MFKKIKKLFLKKKNNRRFKLIKKFSKENFPKDTALIVIDGILYHYKFQTIAELDYKLSKVRLIKETDTKDSKIVFDFNKRRCKCRLKSADGTYKGFHLLYNKEYEIITTERKNERWGEVEYIYVRNEDNKVRGYPKQWFYT